jgi:DNA repair protein RadA/Sms
VQEGEENDDAVPETLEQISRRRRREAASSSSPSSSFATRLPLPTKTGAEIARVLGGGLVPGSVVLIGGDPGVGKSTLLLQAASLVARACCPSPAGDASSSPPADQVGRPVLYVSAEESKEQLWMRAVRLGLVPGEGDEGDDADGDDHASTPPGDLRLVSENRLEAVLSSIASLRPSLVIVDSVQTVLLSGLDHRPGSVAQVRECATALLHAAKKLRTAVLLVGHVTKGGDLAGPKALEHLVDAVIYLEGGGGGAGGGGTGGAGQYRLLRAQKNRHGSVGEVAILRHGPKGLEAVDDYRSLFVSSAAFDGADEEDELEEEEGGLASSSSASSAAAAVGAGSALTVVQEGRRALVIEVQALVAGREAGGGGGGGGYARSDDYNSNNSDDEEDEQDEEEAPRRQRWRGNSGFGPSSSSSSSSAPLYRAAVGFASRERLPLLLEVLAKHGAISPARACRRSHVFASVAGGYRTRPGETATDLALCAALVSSALGARLPRRTAVLGEVGLAGELRPVPELEARLREAAAMGFQRVVVPSANDAPVVAAAADLSSSSSSSPRRRRGASGGGGAGGSGKAPAAPRALDGLRKELGGGGGMEVVSVPTLRAALRYLFGERLRAAGKRQRQQQRARRRARRGGTEEEEEDEEEAALVASALAAAAAAAANRSPLL